MSAAPGLPGYRLRIGRAGAPVRIQRLGPPEPTRIGIGRTPADVARLAGLLFPVCAIAQTSAALSACERAARSDLPSGQVAARETLVLAESVMGCIWRSALTWPVLIGRTPDAAPVREARAALKEIQAALFDGQWAQPGGASLALDKAQLIKAIDRLRRQVDAVCRPAAPFDAAHPEWPDLPSPSCVPLGGDIYQTAIRPAQSMREETPRALLSPETPPRTLRDWLDAQIPHAQRLAQDLVAAASRLSPAPRAAFAAEATGLGLGLAMTARGRLRHVVELENGRVARWEVAAPTDWNLAPGGLLAQLASTLAGDTDPESSAKWLIAAVDPCAPCTVEVDTEPAHA